MKVLTDEMPSNTEPGVIATHLRLATHKLQTHCSGRSVDSRDELGSYE